MAGEWLCDVSARQTARDPIPVELQAVRRELIERVAEGSPFRIWTAPFWGYEPFHPAKGGPRAAAERAQWLTLRKPPAGFRLLFGFQRDARCAWPPCWVW